MCAEVSEEHLRPLLKRFAQLVAHAFYQPKYFLLIDILVKNTIVSEENLSKMLHSEARQLRAVLTQFSKDKLIRTKFKNIPRPEGKPQRISYYYIDYQMFVNVVRFRLYKMGEKLEQEEIHSDRTTYYCTNQECKKTYTELEIDKLMNPMERNLICERCREVVEEEERKDHPTSTRSTILKLNKQLKPINDLLKQFKGATVPTDMIEPSLNQEYFSSHRSDITTEIYSPSSSKDIREKGGMHHRRHEPTTSVSSSREEANVTEALVRGENILSNPTISSFQVSSQQNSDEAEYSDDNSSLGLSVGGTWYKLDEVNEEIVATMSVREKKEYEELWSQAYDDY